MSSLSHPSANFPSERSRQGRLRYPYFENICSTSPVNAADRNGYRIKFFHLEMWHFPSERCQHSRKVNGVVRLHNQQGDQTQQSQRACKPQRATGSGKRPSQLFHKVQNTMARSGQGEGKEGYDQKVEIPWLCLSIFEGNFSGYDGPFTDTLTANFRFATHWS